MISFKRNKQQDKEIEVENCWIKIFHENEDMEVFNLQASQRLLQNNKDDFDE